MGNKELKSFHSENRTHVTKEILKGERLKAQNTAKTPFSIKIFGDSTQKQTIMGKNLFDIEKYKVKYQPEFTIEEGKLTITTTWTNHIYYEIKGLKPSTDYAFSLLSDKQAQMYYNDNNWFTAPTKNADGNYTCSQIIKSTAEGVITIYFRYGTDEKSITYSAWDIQLEEGEKKTAFEPFVPNSPSKEYPSEILPLKNVKLYAGDLWVDIPFVGYEGDYLEYDDKTKVLKRISLINEEKLDFTKPIAEQDANYDVPREQILYKADGYDFSELKTLQGECEIYTDGGAYLEAEVKSVRRA